MWRNVKMVIQAQNVKIWSFGFSGLGQPLRIANGRFIIASLASSIANGRFIIASLASSMANGRFIIALLACTMANSRSIKD